MDCAPQKNSLRVNENCDPTEEVKTITAGGEFTWLDIKHGIRGYCNGSAWRHRVPFTYWLPRYSWQDFTGDLVAGLTVGLTVIPQALAFVIIADLPMEMGLYSAFMGCFVYALLGTAKDVTLGPTSVMSLLTAAIYPPNSTVEDRVNCAVLLAFYSGVVQLILGIFNLGFLVNFVSEPVISGFTSASAFVILYAQIKNLIGVKFGTSSDTVIDQTVGYFNSLRNISGWDTLLGLVLVSALLILRNLTFPKAPKWGLTKRTWSIFTELFRVFKAVRYGFVILLATVLGYYLTIYGYSNKIAMTSDVKSGLPTFKVPQFSWGNRTFTDSLSIVGPNVPFLVLIGSLDVLALAKAFSSQFHYKIVPNQELIALGLSNIAGSFFGGYPVTGSFTRSSLFSQSGVRTPMGCVWTGAFVLLATAVISQAFKYVPRAALASVIVVAVLMLFDFKIFKDLWRISKKELLSILVTIAVSFTVGVDYGLLAGVAVSMLLLLYPLARPVVTAQFRRSAITTTTHVDPVSQKRTLYINVAAQGPLYFPSAEYLKDFFHDYIIDRENEPEDGDLEEIVFDGSHLRDSDYTTLHALRTLVELCSKANRMLTFVNIPQNVLEILLSKDAIKKLELARTVPVQLNEVVVEGNQEY